MSRMVDITIRAPENLLDYLGEVLTLIGSRDSATPEKYVARHAVKSAIALAFSTVDVSKWKWLEKQARACGVKM
jgi:hypothetical protein